ncbi:ArsR family transcriptional regulator [Bacillus canaveralius]|uniref:ArsR family transcriptional regulator n=1 Tax=Bacillus canaveralius TaxID=1403243 RepID=A0A2N5GGJ3_9BACI|nr:MULTISPECIES: metalloregulator ArsR/SmtB family transcription factor [Bacillus]PLR79879.1 ArsR family transcriptional regulator [Bacillus canaveralius]PLR85644.1 ArsR family transcriptional regulator [Bacillus sp. V33-4]PLR96032.1 ArsR family transcriptional regulator [Bacillus canaveralius]RSK51602.1 ArsR family transcriptional regulator [Bacillus canaveralius]
MGDRSLEDNAKILKLLGDKTRLAMLGLLMINECCVCEFVDIFKMSQPAISQHLRKLKDAGLVKENRRGQWIIYSLNRENAFFPMVRDVLKHVPSQEEKFIWLEQQGLRISCD